MESIKARVWQVLRTANGPWEDLTPEKRKEIDAAVAELYPEGFPDPDKMVELEENNMFDGDDAIVIRHIGGLEEEVGYGEPVF